MSSPENKNCYNSSTYNQEQADLAAVATLAGKTVLNEDLTAAMEALVRIQFAYR
jgi:hypothetical protein